MLLQILAVVVVAVMEPLMHLVLEGLGLLFCDTLRLLM
jgi:hypothetical protein